MQDVFASESRSLWSATAEFAPHPPLRGDHHTDVLIIGGGITGVLCAHFLQQAGVSYLLLEATRIGGGVTQNTTAKLTLLHGLLYDQIRRGSAELASQYLRAQQQALAEYLALCQGVDCDYTPQPAYAYDLADSDAPRREAEALRSLGCAAEWVAQVPLPIRIAGAVRCPDQAQFHPLKFLAAISAPLRIHEHTPVLDVQGETALTPHGRVHAKRVIFACHFPFADRRGGYFAKMYQHRSYTLALSGAPLPEGMFVDAQANGLSFRTQGEYLLLGGGDHRTGCAGGGFAALRAIAARLYPDARERYAWSAQDCMSLDGIPYIGAYAKTTPRWYVATGFNKWGMSNAMVAALLLRDALIGEQNPCADVFSPSRSPRCTQLLCNGASSLLHFLTPTAPRCPHLGCALRWNKEERSWDCPCHGSRFNADGAVLDSPANRRLPHAPKR